MLVSGIMLLPLFSTSSHCRKMNDTNLKQFDGTDLFPWTRTSNTENTVNGKYVNGTMWNLFGINNILIFYTQMKLTHSAAHKEYEQNACV